MSQETEGLLEKAIADHMHDEGLLKEGEMLVEWCVVVAAMPQERARHTYGSAITIMWPDTMLEHHAHGLLHFCLFQTSLTRPEP